MDALIDEADIEEVDEKNASGNICVETCPDGYYQDHKAKFCRFCDCSCATCGGPTFADCNMCASGYWKFADICVRQCPPSTWPKTDFVNGNTCEDCHIDCDECLPNEAGTGSTAENCISCPPGEVLNVFDQCTNTVAGSWEAPTPWDDDPPALGDCNDDVYVLTGEDFVNLYTRGGELWYGETGESGESETENERSTATDCESLDPSDKFPAKNPADGYACTDTCGTFQYMDLDTGKCEWCNEFCDINQSCSGGTEYDCDACEFFQD